MKWLMAASLCDRLCASFLRIAVSFTIRFLLGTNRPWPVPDLTGLDTEEAKKVAAKKGLSLLVVAYRGKKEGRPLQPGPQPDAGAGHAGEVGKDRVGGGLRWTESR